MSATCVAALASITADRYLKRHPMALGTRSVTKALMKLSTKMLVAR